MRLSLSSRIAESPKRKDVAAMSIDDLAARAGAAGFAGISVRAAVVSVDSPSGAADRVRALLDNLGLTATMVTGDVSLASNDAGATRALRDIAPYLDLAEGLGCSLVRVMMGGLDDVADARRAADAAAERGIALTHLTHWGTPFETAGDALETLKRIDRANFGVTFEPGNLLACGADCGPDAIAMLAPWLNDFCFQNIRLDPDSAITFDTARCGPVGVRYVAIDDASAIDARPLLAALRQVGYEGWVTVHQPLRDGESVDDAIDAAARFFLPLVGP